VSRTGGLQPFPRSPPFSGRETNETLISLNKGLKNLECLRQKLVDITDRFTGFEAQSLNVHVDFALFQKMALPVASGKTKIAGNKIHDTRNDAAHGGTAARRHATQRMAKRRHPSGHPPASAFPPKATLSPNSGTTFAR
jgi:hypothetical protein